jgi:hypothetical protein
MAQPALTRWACLSQIHSHFPAWPPMSGACRCLRPRGPDQLTREHPPAPGPVCSCLRARPTAAWPTERPIHGICTITSAGRLASLRQRRQTYSGTYATTLNDARARRGILSVAAGNIARMPRLAQFDRMALAETLRKQRGIITRSQAHAHQMTEAVVRYRTRPDGPWQVVLPGVYLDRGGQLTETQRAIAAYLYAGEVIGVTGPRRLPGMAFRLNPATSSTYSFRLAITNPTLVLSGCGGRACCRAPPTPKVR